MMLLPHISGPSAINYTANVLELRHYPFYFHALSDRNIAAIHQLSNQLA